MNQILNLFDAYNLRVRFSVGLILITPVIISIYLLIPDASNFSFTVIILILCFGLCNLMMSLSRFAKCFPKLMPAQQMLMPNDKTLNPITKKRYHEFLSSKIKNLTFKNETVATLNSCKSAVSWLISQTRDSNSFPLIKEETINFGFSKNLYGLKNLGIAISAFLTILQTTIIIAKVHLKFGFVEYTNLIPSTLISFLFTVIWIFFINKEWVKNSGFKYAKTLLSACDSEQLNNQQN